MGSTPLAKRINRLRLSKAALALAARIHENTVARALEDEPRVLASTSRRIEAAVKAEELDLLRHLAALHPQEAVALFGLERPAA